MLDSRLGGSTCAKYMQHLERYHSVCLGIPVQRSARVAHALRGAAVLTPGPRAKPVFGGRQLEVLLRPLRTGDYDSLVLRTALVWSFHTGVRVSHYASGGTYVGTKHVLRWRHVGVRPVGGQDVQRTLLHSSKTMRPNTAAPRPLAMGAVPEDPSLCPVSLFRQLRAAAKDRGLFHRNGHVFTMADGTVLRASQVNAFLHKRAPAIGLPAWALRSHAFRRAFATSAKRAGAGVRTVLRQGQWRVKSSNAVAEELYLHDGPEVFKDLTAKMARTDFVDFAGDGGGPPAPPACSWV